MTATPAHSPNSPVSPTKSSPCISPGTANQEVSLQFPAFVDMDLSKSQEDAAVRSKVARLSIVETDDVKLGIVKKLKEGANGASDASNMSQAAGSKRRRRRSSAVNSPSLGNLKHSNGSSSSLSSVAVPKKKKKSAKSASLRLSEKALKKRISVKDLRDLVLYIFNDTNNAPQWAQIDNRSTVKKVVVLFTPGLQPADFELKQDSQFSESLEELKKKHLISLTDKKLVEGFQNIPVSAPGSKSSLFSAYNSFVNVGLNKKEKEARKEELNKKKVTLPDLLMSVDDLIENEYPIHEETPGLTPESKENLRKQHANKTGWVNTINFEHEGSRTFSMDCEMCLSESGLVLARVSIVDFSCNLIYDKLVKPHVPIVDYLTKYSGITEEKLQDITTTLQDVQGDILRMISSDDILIGHSLESDLNVLKLRHPKIIDTALIYEHKAGPPFKPALRYLASEYLNIEIQNNDAKGHDSFEDARTCMELTKLKIVNGFTFGIGINTENLFHRLGKHGVRSMVLSDSSPRQYSKKSNTSETSIRCCNDNEIIDNIINGVSDYSFFVGRLRELEFARQFATPNPEVKTNSPEEAMDNLGKRLTKMYKSLPSSTLILLFSGTGDTRDWIKIVTELNKLDKADRLNEKKNREEELQAAVAKARDAISLIMIKQEESALIT